MESLIRDLRHGLRTLLNSPGFTVVAILTLALGIGATTAIFSVVNGVLLRPLPYSQPDEIVRLWALGDDGGRMPWSAPSYLEVQAQSHSFAALAAYGSVQTTVTGGDRAVRATVAYVSDMSDGFFPVFGVQPVIGRVFSPDEARQNATVVVVGHGFWLRELGGDRDALGRTLTIDNQPYTVVGVMPPGFAFPARAEFWIPYRVPPDASRTAHNWQAVGRVADGVAVSQARQDVSATAARLREHYGTDIDLVGAAVVPLHEAIVGDVRPTLLMLLGAAACLLLIASANVANLLLARAASRRRELAVRLALGAGRRRLIRQFLAESFLLSFAGGAIGVAVAWWGVKSLLAFAPSRVPRLSETGVDGAVLAFALGVAVLTALGIGLAAALRATGANMRYSLADHERSEGGGVASRRLRGALVASQIALTLVLLVGAGLLARSFLRLLDVEPGYRTRDAVVMELAPPRAGDAEGKVRLAIFYRNLLDELRAIPGVSHAGGIDAFPLTGRGYNGTFLVLDRPDEVKTLDDYDVLAANPARTGNAQFRIASRDYFGAMEIPLLRGRLFAERDGLNTPNVAVISETLAKTRWPNENPLGKLIQYGNMDGDMRPFTIVGVVGDIRDQSVAAAPRSIFYGCSCQRSASLGGPFSIAIRGTADSAALISSARKVVRRLNPDVPVNFSSLEQVFSASLSDRQFSMTLLGVFGVAALTLAALGVYGVIAYLVAQQTREIGVRMALGARSGSIMGYVLRRGAMLALAGLAIGIAIALAATRILSSMLFDVSTTDPAVFVGVTLLLAAIAMLACYIPALRATRVDPMTALREE